MGRETGNCSRCCDKDVLLVEGEKYCVKCAYELTLNLPHHQQAWSYHEMMKLHPGKGKEVSYISEQLGVDPGIVERMAIAHKKVYDYRREHGGAMKEKTPNDIIVEIMGNPEELPMQERIEMERIQCRYLSASATAATWLGYYIPADIVMRSRKKHQKEG